LPAGDIRASIMRVWHFEQRGRSIALSGNIVGVLSVMMRYKFLARVQHLTVTGECLDRTAITNCTKPGTAKSVR
jgi:hypothetical protein